VQDGIPTVEEIHEIVEAANLGQKALTLVFVSRMKLYN
jgi:hypothetical protein